MAAASLRVRQDRSEFGRTIKIDFDLNSVRTKYARVRNLCVYFGNLCVYTHVFCVIGNTETAINITGILGKM